MKIDAHQHFWQFDPIRDAWIEDSMQVIRRDFMPQDLAPILTTNGIDGCVAVQADQSETETEFLLNLAAQNDCIKGVVGWLDILADNLTERLSHYVKNPYFKVRNGITIRYFPFFHNLIPQFPNRWKVKLMIV